MLVLPHTPSVKPVTCGRPTRKIAPRPLVAIVLPGLRCLGHAGIQFDVQLLGEISDCALVTDFLSTSESCSRCLDSKSLGCHHWPSSKSE